MKTKLILPELLALIILLSGCAQQNTTAPTGFLPLEGADSELVAWYKFDEGSGTTAADSSGNANNATLVNNPAWVAGKIGSGALSFNGVNQDVNLARLSSTESATSLTWSFGHNQICLRAEKILSPKMPLISQCGELASVFRGQV